MGNLDKLKQETQSFDRRYLGKDLALTMDKDSFRRKFKSFTNGGEYERGNSLEIAFKLFDIDNISHKVCLDYCCGGGQFGVFFALNGAKVFGFDISSESVKVAQKRAEINRVSNLAKFEIMDAGDLKYDTEQFDLIFGSNVLHHVIKYDDILTKLVLSSFLTKYIHNVLLTRSYLIRPVISSLTWYGGY